MKNILKKVIKNEQGSISLIATFSIVVLFCFCALVADLGVVYVQKQALQNAVDSAALASVSELPYVDVAEQAARDYIVKNGFTIDGITVNIDSGNQIVSISIKKKLGLFFARTFNINSADIDASAKAIREITGLENQFGYRIFSGSNTDTLTLGGTLNIHGGIHANGAINMYGASGQITGDVESRTSLLINDATTTVGSKLCPAPNVPMVDIGNINSIIMPHDYDTVLSASTVNAIYTPQYFSGNTKINGNVNLSHGVQVDGFLHVQGDLIINGNAPSLVFSGNIFASGDIIITNSFTGHGCIMSDKSISFNGGGIELSSAYESIGLYAKTGNINFASASTLIRGIIYAPKGTVNMTGGTVTLYGAIVANKVSGIPSNLTMYPPDFTVDFLPMLGHKSSLFE